MSFDSYKNIGEVLLEFQITSAEDNYIIEKPFKIRDSFREDLEFCLREFTFEESEYAICETIIFPVLKEVYRFYRHDLTLWSHKSIIYDQKLSGIPDYIIAKKDDFIKGWGQCLAEMVAIQKLNNQPEQTIFGIVSNGQLWQFGKLKEDLFTQEIRSYVISDLDNLCAAINYIFGEGLKSVKVGDLQ
jgi:hypothetical protein